MTSIQKKRSMSQRSGVQVLPTLIVAFATILFGSLAIDWDAAQAQEVKGKAKAKLPFENKKYTPKKKDVPEAKSLTAGEKVTAEALTKLIDQEINKRIKADGATSTGKCDDAEFVRRVYLDLVGVIPTSEQTKKFLDNKDADKRSKLIDGLLADSRFGKAIAEQWAVLMVPRESNNRALNSRPMEAWLADHINNGTPLDKIIYDLVTVTGDIDKNPAGTYFVANASVDKITDNVTRMFLGVQLQCAQCHNHPFTDWKQTEYWAMAAFFMKTRVNGNAKAAAKGGAVPSISENAKAPLKKGALPESAKNVPAKFLQGEEPKINGNEMRPTLAKWMTSKDNQFFARAMVNRFWYQAFGRGLVTPVDDMHEDNTPTHPELLATLTEQFKLNGFDIKYLMRAICNSDVYQRSSVSRDDVGKVDPDNYSRREMRVLNPEQLYDSLSTVLGAAAKNDAPKDKNAKKGGPIAPRDNFINFFRIEDANPLEYQVGIPQALRLMNSPFTGRAEATAAQVTAGAKTPADAIEHLYLVALSRRPTTAEVERLTTYIDEPGRTARVAHGNILWALLNSSEFVLNH